jgi:hypothetical protein
VAATARQPATSILMLAACLLGAASVTGCSSGNFIPLDGIFLPDARAPDGALLFPDQGGSRDRNGDTGGDGGPGDGGPGGDRGGADAFDQGPVIPPPESIVTECPNPPLTQPPTGTCLVHPGSGGAVATPLLIQGSVLTPGNIYHNGQLLIDGQGIIACAGCDCSQQADFRGRHPPGVRAGRGLAGPDQLPRSPQLGHRAAVDARHRALRSAQRLAHRQARPHLHLLPRLRRLAERQGLG